MHFSKQYYNSYKLKGEKEYEREREREKDAKMLALIRGSKIRYTMRTKEVISCVPICVCGCVCARVCECVRVGEEGGEKGGREKMSGRRKEGAAEPALTEGLK